MGPASGATLRPRSDNIESNGKSSSDRSPDTTSAAFAAAPALLVCMLSANCLATALSPSRW